MSPNHERDALTTELRALSARLDELDRELADRAWPRKGFIATALPSERELEEEHSRLTAQLRTLANRLHQFDWNRV